MSAQDVQAVRDLIAMRDQIGRALHVPRVPIERIALAVEVLDVLVAGANGGREAFIAAADKVYFRLQRPSASEIRELAVTVAPSTRSTVDVVAAVFAKRVEGGTWEEAGRAGGLAVGLSAGLARYYRTDSTARRWADLATMSQRRFRRAFAHLPPERISIGKPAPVAARVTPGKEVVPVNTAPSP